LRCAAPYGRRRAMRSRRFVARLLVPFIGTALLSACATPGQYQLAERDPLEKFNRGVWGVNRAADKVVIKPATQVYRAVAPRPVRQGVSNVFANLGEPWSFVNNVLQGKPNRAGRNFARFLVNSTIGVAGLWDPASKMGIRSAPEDFGQTLGVWGVNGGPYLVLPLLGPSTLRDGIGSGVAAYADPVKVAINQADINVWYKRGYLASYIISTRSDLIESGGDAFLETSLDPYAAARSAYLQLRTAAIRDDDDSGAGGTELPGGAPAANGVPSPAGNAATMPSSAAPLPGDEPASPQPSTMPQSSAPLPGDDTSAPAPAAPPSTEPVPAAAPPSAAPLPGDDTPPAGTTPKS
jgi:phospholipid-binding lipoprotein MlaA